MRRLSSKTPESQQWPPLPEGATADSQVPFGLGVSIGPTRIRLWCTTPGVGVTLISEPPGQDPIDVIERTRDQFPEPLNGVDWAGVIVSRFLLAKPRSLEDGSVRFRVGEIDFTISADFDVSPYEELIRAVSTVQPPQRRHSLIALVEGLPLTVYETSWLSEGVSTVELEGVLEKAESQEVGPTSAASKIAISPVYGWIHELYLSTAPTTIATLSGGSPYITAAGTARDEKTAAAKSISEAAERSAVYGSALVLSKLPKAKRSEITSEFLYDTHFTFTKDQIDRDHRKAPIRDDAAVRTLFTEEECKLVCDELVFVNARLERIGATHLNSSGMAAHVVPGIAQFNAKRELIERHQFIKWWHSGLNFGRSLEISELGELTNWVVANPRTKWVVLEIGRFQSEKIALAIAIGDRGLSTGLSSGSLAEAAYRAMLEAWLGQKFGPPGRVRLDHRSVRTAIDHATYWLSPSKSHLDTVIALAESPSRPPECLDLARISTIKVPGARSSRTVFRALSAELVQCTFGYDNIPLGHQSLTQGCSRSQELIDQEGVFLPHILG